MRTLVAFLLATLCTFLAIQSLAQPMPKTYTDGKFGKLEYGFYTPEKADKTKSYPLVMFLHGWSANQTVYLPLYNKDMQREFTCFVYTPKTPTTWADWSGWNETSLSESMLATIHVLDSLIKVYPIDTNRLYVYGISMGGEGVFDLLHKLPYKFAAGISICGGGEAAWAENIALTPLWMFHGSKDNINPPELTERVYYRLIELGAKNARYTNYEGYGHEIWKTAQSEPDFYKWLFSFSKLDK